MMKFDIEFISKHYQNEVMDPAERQTAFLTIHVIVH